MIDGRGSWIADLVRELRRDEGSWDAERIVRQAYLRTLSRYPTGQELERAAQFVLESDDPIDGARGLLWALINTKEFIVNH
jgi:hypothetical protein